MTTTVREAVLDDLPAIAALTKAHRHQLATWAPRWWRTAQGADDLHPLWLSHLITSDPATVRVIVDGDAVIGTASALAQPGQFFIDDVAVTDDSSWATCAPALVAGITERPAITCLATADRARSHALAAEGIALVSTYWVRSTRPGPVTDAGYRDDAPPAPPVHSFGGELDPSAPGALAFSIDAGTVIGSPSVAAPPVFDPGGTVTVVDRMFGPDLDTLVEVASATAAARADVLMAVVCSVDDHELAATLGAHDFERTVDVHRWPTATR